MKKSTKVLLFIIVLLILGVNPVHAEEYINLTIRSGATIIYQDSVTLPDAGNKDYLGHSLDARSVLSVLDEADQVSELFSLSDVVYYDSFGSFYLNCINSSVGDRCDNWQYLVNDAYPGISMDQKILSGGENIYLYWGPQNRVTLSSASINTEDTLVVTTQEYEYTDNTWKTRVGVTVGLTQPNPDDAFSPLEQYTKSVDDEGKAVFNSVPVTGTYNVGVKEDYYFPTEELHVDEIIHGGSIGGGSYTVYATSSAYKEYENETLQELSEEKSFDIDAALNFLIENQKEDGSFGEDLFTDWAAMALASRDNVDANSLIKLIKYLSRQDLPNASLTDYERHAMALMSIGLDPYNTNGINYIGKITNSFNGGQFGDINEDNDDIFALLVLLDAGFDKKNEQIQNSLDYILGKQLESGSWDESIDMTAAAIQVLANFDGEKIDTAIKKARGYIYYSEKWDNVSSTSWILNAIYSLDEDVNEWKKEELNPLEYLESMQSEDGGIMDEDDNLKNRIWKTSYAIIGASNKTWNEIMQDFEQPIEEMIEEKVDARVAEILKAINRQKIVEPQTVSKKTEVKNNNPITATVINSLSENKTNPSEKSWFAKFIDILISIF